ncbi:hypothetical protein [uncultured Deinococcus sp.]|uniref:hypothetical protein n=1 Tax=uncultured Deinococcus sp. TaxID=158789 RepID=UPI0025DA9B55|nr:hypothetical protein [uncultured Deinococcus sp.]
MQTDVGRTVHLMMGREVPEVLGHEALQVVEFLQAGVPAPAGIQGAGWPGRQPNLAAKDVFQLGRDACGGMWGAVQPLGAPRVDNDGSAPEQRQHHVLGDGLSQNGARHGGRIRSRVRVFQEFTAGRPVVWGVM